MEHSKRRADAILVIGAGELGMAVVRALVAASAADGGSVTVALRPGLTAGGGRQRDATDEMRRLGVDVVHVDLAGDPVERLADVFGAFSTVVCCAGFVAGRGTQTKITAAVLRAGVDRYVPWQFGVDYDRVGRGSGQAVWDEQLDVRDMLRAQSRTHWVIVSTGMFTSFLFEPAFGLVDLDAGEVRALGSWRNRLTVTTPDDIGRLTAAILAHRPRVEDQVVFVAGDTFSYAELADTVERHLGRPVVRTRWDTTRLRADADAAPDDAMRAYRLAFARDAGVAWDMEGTFNATNGIAVTSAAAWLRAHRPEACAGNGEQSQAAGSLRT